MKLIRAGLSALQTALAGPRLWIALGVVAGVGGAL